MGLQTDIVHAVTARIATMGLTLPRRGEIPAAVRYIPDLKDGESDLIAVWPGGMEVSGEEDKRGPQRETSVNVAVLLRDAGEDEVEAALDAAEAILAAFVSTDLGLDRLALVTSASQADPYAARMLFQRESIVAALTMTVVIPG